MTDDSNTTHEPNDRKDARPQVGETSGNTSKSPLTAEPNPGDRDRRTIGDESDRGMRQDTQGAGSRDRSSDDRSSSKEQSGKSQQSGSPGMRTDDKHKSDGARSAPGKDSQTKRGEEQTDRRSK